MPRPAKLAVAVLADASLCVLTTWIAICLRYEALLSLEGYQWLAVLLSIALAIPMLMMFGFYQSVIRFAGKSLVQSAVRAIGVYGLIYAAIFTAYGVPSVPRTIGVLQPLLLLIGLGLVRHFAHQLLTESASGAGATLVLPSVLIYGAGNAGQQLAASLNSSRKGRVVGFIDDSRSLQGAKISGYEIFSPSEIGRLCAKYSVQDILLAMPNLARSRRAEIIHQLSTHRVTVRTLPSLSDLAQGKLAEGQLREVAIEDLLGRDPVAPMQHLLRKNISGKTVVVTGAGGSIGSELCRQIVQLEPSHLVLLDVSEYAVYKLNEELGPIGKSKGFKVTPLLVNVLDRLHLADVFAQYQPNTVYHAAAYKHVPLVEINPLSGLRNNVLGTWHVALASIDTCVQDLVLISTDKAVRPTNIMGASKRIAEMTLQALANAHRERKSGTRFSIVRFGNVLGSSGSVIPKFREQIKMGGPVTVTHREVTRYFMTIPEAAQLVIQAAALPTNSIGEAQIFLLDMGKSIKIVDLAKTLIALSGLSVKEDSNPTGDIEIVATGLRAGEKLYEELLIAGQSSATLHPKIVTSIEPYPLWSELEKVILELQSTSDSQIDVEQASKLFQSLEVGYTAPNTGPPT